MGDFGNATEVIRIVDRFAFKVSPKIRTDATFDFCNTIPSKAEIPTSARGVGIVKRRAAFIAQCISKKVSAQSLRRDGLSLHLHAGHGRRQSVSFGLA